MQASRNGQFVELNYGFIEGLVGFRRCTLSGGQSARPGEATPADDDEARLQKSVLMD